MECPNCKHEISWKTKLFNTNYSKLYCENCGLKFEAKFLSLKKWLVIFSVILCSYISINLKPIFIFKLGINNAFIFLIPQLLLCIMFYFIIEYF